MTTSIIPSKIQASRDLEKAHGAVKTLLLSLDRDSDVRNSTPWADLYYTSHSISGFNKKFAAFIRAFPHIGIGLALTEAALKVTRAFKVLEEARAQEKARITAVREARAAKAATVAKVGIDLTKHEFATPETYKTLRAALEPVRVAVEAHYIEVLTERAAFLVKKLGDDYRVNFSLPNRYKAGSTSVELPEDYYFFFERVSPFGSKPRADMTDRIAAKAEYQAIAETDAFAGKLAGKIDRDADGKALAKVQIQARAGFDLWNRSFLVAILADNSEQQWSTQVIWNHSYLGTSFNQWPTRRVS